MPCSSINNRIKHYPPYSHSYPPPDPKDASSSSSSSLSQSSSNSYYSLASSSLSSGIITVHTTDNASVPNLNGNTLDLKSDNISQNEDKNYSHSFFSLAGLHHTLKLTNDMIIDHAWTQIQISAQFASSSSSSQPNSDNLSTNTDSEIPIDESKDTCISCHDGTNTTTPLHVLIMITRTNDGSSHGEYSATTTTTTTTTATIEKPPNHSDFIGNLRCITNLHIIWKKNNNIYKDSTSHHHHVTIPLSYIANSVTTNENVLLLCTSTGVVLCNIEDIIQWNQKLSTSSSVSISSSTTTIYDLWDKITIKLFRSCPIHAIHTYHNLLAIAAGDRIGIWNLDDIIKVLHSNRDDDKRHVQKQPRPPCAVWHTKLENISSKITCITFSYNVGHDNGISNNGNGDGNDADVGNILAISCWDGSAFVFRRCRHHSGEYENIWNRVTHSGLLSSLSPSINTAKTLHSDEKHQHQYHDLNAIWETSCHVPNSDNSSVGGQYFSTFLSLYTIIEDNIYRSFMVISTPASPLIRIYDLDFGIRCNDLVFSSSKLYPCYVEGMRLLPRKVNDHEIINTLILVDSKDNIHRYILPSKSDKASSMQSFEKLPKFPIYIASYSLHHGKEQNIAWVSFNHSQEYWSLNLSWYDAVTNKRKYHLDISLPFLNKEVIYDLMVEYMVNDGCLFIHHDKLDGRRKDRHRIVLFEKYLIISVPSALYVLIYGRDEKGWKLLDTSSELILSEITGMKIDYDCKSFLQSYFNDKVTL